MAAGGPADTLPVLALALGRKEGVGDGSLELEVVGPGWSAVEGRGLQLDERGQQGGRVLALGAVRCERQLEDLVSHGDPMAGERGEGREAERRKEAERA